MTSGYLVLLSGVGGVTLTVIAGFIGAWVQGRREHKAWERERRFDTYLDFERFMSEFEYFKSGGQSEGIQDAKDRVASAAGLDPRVESMRRIVEDGERIQRRRIDVLSALALVGPDEVYTAAQEWMNASRTEDRERLVRASVAATEAMQKAVGIRR